MNPIDLTTEQRQLIINMADLWVRQNGIAQAGAALVIVSMMQDKQKAPAPAPAAALEPPQPEPEASPES